MTREEILQQYKVKEDKIISPGKFQGCPIFAPHFWSLGLEGFADRDINDIYVFKINKKDIAEWPELGKWIGRKRTLMLSEDNFGFVECI